MGGVFYMGDNEEGQRWLWVLGCELYQGERDVTDGCQLSVICYLVLGNCLLSLAGFNTCIRHASFVFRLPTQRTYDLILLV